MFRGMFVAGLALASVVGAGPVSAVPKPRGDQWWLSTTGIQQAWKQSTGQGVTVALIDGKPVLGLREFRGARIRKGRDFRRYGDGFVKPPEWDQEHGTGMLSLIAAQGGGSGYQGAAPDAEVLTIPVNGGADFREALRYAIDQGADVVNMSFAGVDISTAEPVCDAGWQEAVDYAAEHDVVLVAGAGNNRSSENLPYVPAMCPGVLAVAGLSKELTLRKKPVRQPYIAIAAPSDEVSSLRDSGALWVGDGGTSSAAALTTAAIALLRSAHPGESARQIVARLLYAAQDVHTPGWDDHTGYGLIRPDRALTATVPSGFANTVYDRFDAWHKEQAELKQQRENPPDFAVGGDPNRERSTSSDWETYAPWLLGAGALSLAAVFTGFLVFRRRRRGAARSL
ncbi:S8 family serine peptidase [Actinocorallia aurantiaca]|uniref:Peptidase S8/S53 domain-containing protein n=1 Tax=Actinocorallia aurantiaca TaxID=46204 RepID=A0ABP6GQC2_9ACTN